MNPQLYQSIQMMALPLIDLRFRIQQELEANPALEVLEDRFTLSLDDERRKADKTEPPEEYDYFEDSSDPGFTRSYDSSAGDTKRMFMEGALSRPESLQEHLLWQLRVQPISPEMFEIGELLIRNLDENGFHRDDPYTMISAEKRSKMEAMIETIRTFEPIGTCTRDYRESLLVQTRIEGVAPEGTEAIIENHLDLLEKGKYAEIAKKLKLDEDDVHECLDYIRTLTPFPGRLYSTEEPRYVIPDLMVTLKDGQYVIIMNDEEIPVLGVNPFFTEVVRNTKRGTEKELKQFVNSCLKDARWSIHRIHQRNQTLLKVSRAIVEFQRDFFVKGPKYLVPLTLKDIAAEVGVHEATVSRITTGKYVQTEWGIYELKYFFSNSISGSGSSGSRFSKEGVKQVVKEILENEGSKEHLSDRKISEILEKRGIKIARRTVAKYRKELDISSSYDR